MNTLQLPGVPVVGSVSDGTKPSVSVGMDTRPICLSKSSGTLLPVGLVVSATDATPNALRGTKVVPAPPLKVTTAAVGIVLTFPPLSFVFVTSNETVNLFVNGSTFVGSASAGALTPTVNETDAPAASDPMP